MPDTVNDHMSADLAARHAVAKRDNAIAGLATITSATLVIGWIVGAVALIVAAVR